MEAILSLFINQVDYEDWKGGLFCAVVTSIRPLQNRDTSQIGNSYILYEHCNALRLMPCQCCEAAVAQNMHSFTFNRLNPLGATYL